MPDRNPGQYRQYLGGLYDVLSARAQREHLTPRLSREEFIETMIHDVAGITQGTWQQREAAQQRAAQGVIGRLESIRGGQ